MTEKGKERKPDYKQRTKRREKARYKLGGEEENIKERETAEGKRNRQERGK